jgi:hypothetical protein
MKTPLVFLFVFTLSLLALRGALSLPFEWQNPAFVLFGLSSIGLLVKIDET